MSELISTVYQNELKAILLITIACPELVSGVNADPVCAVVPAGRYTIKVAFEV